MPQFFLFAIGWIFFCSGLASLVYQTLWVRVLSLAVGSSALSLSLVLSIFFTGLGVGSYIAARWANRITLPLRAYALLEIGIGVYSFFLIYVLFLLQKPFAVVSTWSFLGGILPFFFVVLLLLPPTMAMGATLPILVRLLVVDRRHIGTRVGMLYAINTMGAVIGAFASGFLLVPKFGVVGANHLAAFVNILSGAVALFLAQNKNFRKNFQRAAVGDAFAFSLRHGMRLSNFQKVLLCSAGIIGFASIAMEVVWSKYLGIFLGTNIYGLSLVLSLVLLGIAVGSACLALVVDRILSREALAIVLLALGGLSLVAATHLLNYAPVAAHVLGYYAGNFLPLLWLKAFVAAAILIIPTSLIGACLPLTIRILGERAKDAPEVTGVVYALNTFGAIGGAFAAGILLIPHFGSAATLQLSVFLIMGSGLAMVAVWRSHVFLRSALGLFFLGAFWLTSHSSNLSFKYIIQSAYYQYNTAQMSLAEVLKYFARDSEDFEKIIEGDTSVISLSYEKDNGNYLWLRTNGLNESYFDMDRLGELPKYEGMLAFLPYALKPNATRAFVVGYGGGYSVDFLTSVGVAHVHVAEIEPAVIEAAKYAYRGKNPILARSNLELEIEDARRALLLAKKPFDIIISQPSHSWLSGVANLFTREFFELVRGNLSQRGVYAQWLNLYNTDVDTLRSIMRTFYSVFPHGQIFTDIEDSEMILIGSREPLRYSMAELARLAADQRIREQLAQIPIQNEYDIFPQFLITREEAMEAAGDAPINTDRNAYAEVRESRLFYTDQTNRSSEWLNGLYRGKFSDFVADKKAGSPDFYAHIIESLQKKSNNFYKFNTLFNRLASASKGDAADYLRLGNFSYRMERYSTAIEYLEKSLAAKPASDSLNSLLASYLAVNRLADAEALLKKHERNRDTFTSCYEFDMKLERHSPSADALAKRIERDFEKYKDLCGFYLDRLLGLYYFQRHDYKRALPHLEDFNESYPNDLDVIGKMISAYLITGERETAQSYMDQYPNVQAEEARRLEQVAEYYRSLGHTKDAKELADKAERISGAKLSL